jgi:hypothetical protein
LVLAALKRDAAELAEAGSVAPGYSRRDPFEVPISADQNGSVLFADEGDKLVGRIRRQDVLDQQDEVSVLPKDLGPETGTL